MSLAARIACGALVLVALVGLSGLFQLAIVDELVETASDLARTLGFRQAYYWVGADNGRAIGFAKNLGFRSTGYRRPARTGESDLDGEVEVALVLSLDTDTTVVPNPTSGRPAPRSGPTS